MTAPDVWQAVGIRALIGLGFLFVCVVGMAGFAAGLREGRRR
jgi:hypothetical protein